MYSQNNAVAEEYEMALTARETEDITVAERESRVKTLTLTYLTWRMQPGTQYDQIPTLLSISLCCF